MILLVDRQWSFYKLAVAWPGLFLMLCAGAICGAAAQDLPSRDAAMTVFKECMVNARTVEDACWLARNQMTEVAQAHEALNMCRAGPDTGKHDLPEFDLTAYLQRLDRAKAAFNGNLGSLEQLVGG